MWRRAAVWHVNETRRVDAQRAVKIVTKMRATTSIKAFSARHAQVKNRLPTCSLISCVPSSTAAKDATSCGAPALTNGAPLIGAEETAALLLRWIDRAVSESELPGALGRLFEQYAPCERRQRQLLRALAMPDD